VSAALDKVLKPNLMKTVDVLPKAIILDFSHSRLTDVTGLAALSEVMMECRKKGVLIAIINATRDVQKQIDKFGIKSDNSPEAETMFSSYIRTAEDGRMYVSRSTRISTGEFGSGREDDNKDDDVEALLHHSTTMGGSPISGSNRKKPEPDIVGSTNRQNFHVPGLYPPLAGLDNRDSTILPINSSSQDARDDVIKGEKFV